MCGILALFNFPNKNPINRTIQDQLQKLQHRGQDSHGYYLTNHLHEELSILKPGLVTLQEELSPTKVEYQIGLGHTRYATSYRIENKNTNLLEHIQPIFMAESKISFCFNGNINNLQSVVDNLNLNISSNKLDEYNDTLLLKEIFLQNDTSTPEKLEELLIECIKKIKGVFSLLLYHQITGNLYACKDGTGNRPLCLGKNQDGLCFASESVALGDYHYMRELEAGELVRFNSKQNNIETLYLEPKEFKKKHICLFEYIYLQRKDSIVKEKIQVEDLRVDFGDELARQEFLKIDKSNKKDIVVIGAPSTGIPIGVSFAKQLDIPYHQFIQKRRGAQRSFIESNNKDRLAMCRRKFIIDENYSIENKIVFFVDDSLVRGNTIYSIMELLKSYKPKEIHFRIAAPEVKFPCYFGIDIPTREELIMNEYTPEELAKYLGVNSIRFLNTKNMTYVLKNNLAVSNSQVCLGCFNGNYSANLDF